VISICVDTVERRAEVVGRLKALEEAAALLVTFLQNPNAVQELRSDKQYNLQMQLKIIFS
jgi:translation initiation factor 3 subunit E